LGFRGLGFRVYAASEGVVLVVGLGVSGLGV